ncbi:MAG: ubiquinone/menaquinone biosynthesis methyltransferase [Verrucomicrobia bacterium]|nr:ubiquinone/menaquinone biosynthesis methyltransferase [Verrucomicrobiota bacterium]MBV8484179.1 ubiquinone/menaquinone biosynthesis methyltransferase [Verrucomicrobiota bacterium]
MPSPFSAANSKSIREMFAGVAPRYDLANQILSLGLDRSWRKFVCRRVAAWKPSRILDLATGSGVLAEELARTNTGSFVVGADFCIPMLKVARKRDVEHLIVADGLALPFADASFDVITVAFGLRNMAFLERALAELARTTRSGGHVVILDFSLPSGPLLPAYRFYLHFVLPRLAGWLTGEPAAYQYLGDSIESFPRGTAMTALMEEAGFVNAIARPLSGGIVTAYLAERG